MADVTIVIPCFNHNEVLFVALDSLCRLTNKPTEVLVIDDGSEQLVSLTGKPYPFKTEIIRTTNRGLAAARNTGLFRASQPWVLFLDSDDTLKENALDILDSISVNACIDVISSPYILVKNDVEQAIFPAISDPLSALLQSNIGPCHSFLFSREKLVELNGYDEAVELRKGHEDYDLLARLVLNDACFITQYQPTCHYVQFAGSMSTHIANMKESKLWVWRRLFLQAPINTSHQLLQAMHFFAGHVLEYLEYWPEDIATICERFNHLLEQYRPSTPEINSLLSQLPSEISQQIELTKVDLNLTCAPDFPIAQQVFDWRAQSYLDALLLKRLVRSNACLRKINDNRLAVWGINEQAENIVALMAEQTTLLLIDVGKSGQHVKGHVIYHPEDINWQGNWPVLITAHKAYDFIYDKLINFHVAPERIF